MIVTYLRSSSYGCHDMCAMKYFLEYNLGWRGPSNLAAEKGTVVHKILEILGFIKLMQQENRTYFNDDILGRVYVNKYYLDDIISRCTDYYKQHSIHEWKPLDVRHCRDWTHKALDYNNGEHDPRNIHIIQPEQAFDITIDKPWAKYKYDMPDGSVLEGQLSIKGTIDQISKVDDETYQIMDFKTGKRKNWATDEEYDYAALQKNPQLMMYYYAIQHLYPEIDHFQLVIFYIRFGGPYTLCFSKEDLPHIENMIRDKFEVIKSTKIPELTKSWKCTKFCHFGKTTFENSSILPIIEQRDNQVTPKGQFMTKCEQTKYCIENRDLDTVMKHMTAPEHKIDYYHAPGEVSNG